MKGSYDVVIVGGGVHGLAAAYYLATNHGITDVAVLDKGYMGSGGSGRNTAILRSNYLTPEGVRFYDRSVQLYQRLATDLDYNVMFSQRGHLTLAHSDASLRTMRWRAEVNKVEGVDSEVIGPAEIKRLAPFLDVSPAARYPDHGRALAPARRHHPPRRRGLGVRARRLRAGRAHPPEHRGHRHRRGGRPGARGEDEQRRHRHRWCSTPPPGGPR
jgi:Glycine/D-amino acid oxidases (deaminating)